MRDIKIKKEIYRSEFRRYSISACRVAIRSFRACQVTLLLDSILIYYHQGNTPLHIRDITKFRSLSLFPFSLSLPFTCTRYMQVFQLCRLQSSFRYRQPHGHSRALTLTTKRINAAAHLTRIEIFGEYSSLSWSSVPWILVEIFMVQFALLFTLMIRRCGESP